MKEQRLNERHENRMFRGNAVSTHCARCRTWNRLAKSNRSHGKGKECRAFAAASILLLQQSETRASDRASLHAAPQAGSSPRRVSLMSVSQARFGKKFMFDGNLVGDNFPQFSILVKVAEQGFKAYCIPNIPQRETGPSLLFSKQVDIARSATVACEILPV
jgi:hypothetical protein